MSQIWGRRAFKAEGTAHTAAWRGSVSWEEQVAWARDMATEGRGRTAKGPACKRWGSQGRVFGKGSCDWSQEDT